MVVKGKIGQTAEGFWIISGWGYAFTTQLKAEKFKKLKIQEDVYLKKLTITRNKMKGLSL